jgi:hypothetical protein
MEVSRNEMSFWINDKALGVAFRDSKLMDENVHPFVCMIDKGDTVKAMLGKHIKY